MSSRGWQKAAMCRAGSLRSTPTESQIPLVATAKIDGLKRFYGISDERGLSFFTVHETADVWHARTGAELIARHCATDHDRELALDAGNRALSALWSLLDAC